MNKNKISPFLWFDTQAQEAAAFYVSAFADAKLMDAAVLNDTPSGNATVVSFELAGHKFTAMSAGPAFKTNPSVSFMVNFDPSRDTAAREHLDTLWGKLSLGGKIMMPLGEYPFSKHYGWVEDRFGVSWQLILTNPAGEPRPMIIPSLMFTHDVCGRAEEAATFYCSVFKNSKKGTIARYGAGMEPDREGTIMFSDFMLEGAWFAAMDSAHNHNFSFSEGISFVISCTDQAEVDYYWSRLLEGGTPSQCGWLKDKFGFSWQVVPEALSDYIGGDDEAGADRAMQAMLKMSKLDIDGLKKAYEGK